MAGAWLGQVGQERPFPESLAGLGHGWGNGGRNGRFPARWGMAGAGTAVS